MRRRLSTERRQTLGSIALFAGCSDRELAEIDGLASEVSIPAGEVVIREGRPGRESFVIVAGEASVSVRGREIATLGPGEFFGETAVLASGPRTATVSASTPMLLLVVDAGSFLRLLGVGDVAKRILTKVAQRQVAAAKAALPGELAEQRAPV